MDAFYSQLTNSLSHISIVFGILTLIVNLIFSAGVAKDIGNLHQRGIPTQFVPGFAWIIATLAMGIWAALIYWLMHHSSLARKF
ncbi:hypothetical protein L3V83_05790 [Thiotrichales bacterium 19X7-9]|nr:hypothetical protein [Thiotrichales bacterium 19X7-9]